MPYSVGQFKAVLNGLGYSLGPAKRENGHSWVKTNEDNELDLYTQAAIQEFQTYYKLPVTGVLDSQTQEKARQLIRNLQHSLNVTVKAQLPISEFYGDGTTTAVQLFQYQHGLLVTGIASAAVRQALEEAVKRELRQQLNCLMTRRDNWQIV